MVTKARTIALGYVLPFVRRHLTGQPVAGDLDILRGTELPPDVDEPTWWSHLDAWQTPQWNERPIILTSRVDGCDADRLVIDDFARDQQNAPVPPTSSEGWPVSVAPPGFATRLEVLESPQLHHHDLTSVMDVAWNSPGRIEWDLGGLDPSIAATRTHLSFRVANVLEAQNDDDGECVLTAIHEGLTFSLELESEQGTYTRAISPIVQDRHLVAHPLLDAPFCSWQNMMHEVVVPLAQACEGFPVQKLRFVFGGGAGSAAGRVFIDSLQLLSRPDEIGGCP